MLNKNIKKRKIRKYEQRVAKNVVANKDFLILRLKNAWEEAEQQAKREIIIRRAKEGGIFIARSILGLAVIGGVITVALVTPKVFGVVEKLGGHKQFYNKKDFKRSITYLRRKGFINVNREGKDGYQIALTAKGLRSELLDTFKSFTLPKQKWDGYWRIITFDIPRTCNAARNTFREKLKFLGFYKLHASVFVMPYPCEEEIGYLISILELAPYVHVIKATKISIEKTLKEHFRLE